MSPKELEHTGKGIALRVEGNSSTGYHAVICYNGEPAAKHGNQGEFTAVFENGDHSIQCDIADWKAESWSGDERSVALQGQVFLEPLHTYVNITVTYNVKNEHVVEKRISLEQHNASVLYYRLQNRLEPASEPRSYWSFEQENCEGGPLLEIFPAAGFRYGDGLAVGLLTDNGYKNQWTKNVKRRTLKGGMMALKRTPDVDLVKAANKIERESGSHYVELNFGGVRDYRLGPERIVKLPEKSEWIKVNGGFNIPVQLNKTSVYRLKLAYKTNVDDLAMRLTDEGGKNYSFNFFDKGIEKSPDEWTGIVRTFMPIRMIAEEPSAYLYIGSDAIGGDPSGGGAFDIRDIELVEKTPVLEAYHPIRAGEKAEKTLFVFADQANTLRELRIASQIRLAEGLGFEGTEAEKIFYADREMLIWIPEPGDFTPHVVPSLGYAIDMYNRDSFWTAIAWHDKEVNEGVYRKWALSIDDRGCIRTIWTPYVGDLENADNESNLYFIIWAYVNKKRFGSDIDLSVVQRALDYCRLKFDPGREGKYICRTPAWMDMIWLKTGVLFAVNQGLYVNALKCAKELGCDVEEAEIANAMEAYRSLYDEERGYVAFSDRSYQNWDCISPSSLLGEFVSFWLWNEGILSDEAVIGTLEAMPVHGGCSPNLIRGNGEYFFRENNPFINDWFVNPGDYLNGGSWMLYEYCAYAAGLRHGWSQAKKRMEDRIEAEFNTYPDEPFSHEHIPLNGQSDCYHKVFGWNTFMLVANEVAGLGK